MSSEFKNKQVIPSEANEEEGRPCMQECVREGLKLVMWVIYFSVLVSTIVALLFWMWSFILYDATEAISVLFQEAYKGDCYSHTMKAIMGKEFEDRLTSFAYWFESSLGNAVKQFGGLFGCYLILEVSTNWINLGEIAQILRRKMLGITFLFILLSFVSGMIDDKVTSIPGVTGLVGAVGILYLCYVWTRETKAFVYGYAFGFLVFCITLLSISTIFIVRGFLHATPLDQSIRRLIFSVSKAIVIGPTLFMLRTACNRNSMAVKTVLNEDLMGILIVSFSMVCSFLGRILQTGGGTYEIVLIMEIVAAVLEISETMDFVNGLTCVDLIKNVWHRLRWRKARPKGEAPSGGFAKVLSFVTLLNMVSEASGSLIATAYLLLLRVSFDGAASSPDTLRIVGNSLIGFFGEIFLSDFPIFVYICWTSHRKDHVVTLQSLKSAKTFFDWKIVLQMVILFMYGFVVGGRLIIEELCPVADGDAFFLRVCAVCE